MRGIVVLGVVLVFLVSGERLWGDTPESTGAQESQSLLTPGQPAPDFVAHDPDGIPVALHDYLGRPVIINFWATWCAPCRQEMRALQTVYEAHKAAGLAVLAVSQDQQDKGEAVRAYCMTLGITFSPLLDPDGQVATPYKVFLLPSTVFIHPSGTVVAVHLGAMTPAQIEQYLRAILPRPE
jgi:peroxiredoxin